MFKTRILKAQMLCCLLAWSGFGFATIDGAYCAFLYRTGHMIRQKNSSPQPSAERTLRDVRPVRGGAPSAVPSLPEVWDHIQVQDKKTEDRIDILIQELQRDREENTRRYEEQKAESDRKFEESNRKYEEQKAESDRKYEESNRKYEEQKAESDRKFEESNRRYEEQKTESDRKFEESNRRYEEQKAESDRKFEAVRQEFKVVNRTLTKLLDRVNSNDKKWGDFIEAIIEGDFTRVMRGKGVNLINFRPNVVVDKPNYKDYEFDGIGEGEKEVVVLEVKSTLNSSDINRFLHKLNLFREFFPEYQDLAIYGAIGYMKASDRVKAFAEREGLYLVKGISSNTVITNREQFVPRAFD